MATEKNEVCCQKNWRGPCGGSMCGIYFLTFIGAAIYFTGQTTGFWPDVLSILKAIIWPAFLIHKVFVLIGM